MKTYCDTCERVITLTEDGYCPHCGKHADNMKHMHEPINATGVAESMSDWLNGKSVWIRRK